MNVATLGAKVIACHLVFNIVQMIIVVAESGTRLLFYVVFLLIINVYNMLCLNGHASKLCIINIGYLY